MWWTSIMFSSSFAILNKTPVYVMKHIQKIWTGCNETCFPVSACDVRLLVALFQISEFQFLDEPFL